MDKILAHWGLEGESLVHIQTSANGSTWGVGDKFVLRRQDGVARLARCFRLSELLAEEGVPAVVFVRTKLGEWTSPDGEHCLTQRMEGAHMDFFASPEAAVALGKGLARLHLALAKIESELMYEDYDFICEWSNYIKPGLGGAGSVRFAHCAPGVSDEIVRRVEGDVLAAYVGLPRCPIHRDVHAQNVLFCDGAVSGWLDFGLTRKDARVFDLAYFLAGLLVGRQDDSVGLETWRVIYRNLLAGYKAVSPLQDAETEILPALMIAIELLFVTYWNGAGNVEARDEAGALAAWLHENGAVLCARRE